MCLGAAGGTCMVLVVVRFGSCRDWGLSAQREPVEKSHLCTTWFIVNIAIFGGGDIWEPGMGHSGGVVDGGLHLDP